MLLKLVIKILYVNKVQAFQFKAKLEKILLNSLYKLWICKYSVIHTKVLSKAVIEKISNLREEIEKILKSTKYLKLLEKKKINPPKRVATISIYSIHILFYSLK